MSLINVKGNGTYKSLNKLFTNNIYNCGNNSIIDTLMLNEKGKVIDKTYLLVILMESCLFFVVIVVCQLSKQY